MPRGRPGGILRLFWGLDVYRFLPQRIAYGRAVRDEAERLIYLHGFAAREEAKKLVREQGGDAEDAAFYRFVAARVDRILGHGPWAVDYRERAGMRGAS